MSEVNVQLTADEADLLRGIAAAEKAEQEHEQQLRDTAAAGDSAGRAVGDGAREGAENADKELQRLQKQFRAAGKVGRGIGARLTESWTAQGKAGRESVDSLVAKLQELDPASAAVAREYVENLNAADREAEFDGTIAKIKSIGGTASQVIDGMRDEFAQLDFQPPNVDQYIERLRTIDPVAASIADKVDASFSGIDPELRLTRVKAALAEVGGGAAEAADMITAQFAATGTDTTGLQSYLAEMRALGPEAAKTADEIERRIEEADKKADFDRTVDQLRRLGPEGADAATKIKEDMIAADREAAGDMTEILDRLKSIDPTVSTSADKVKRELEEAARFSEGKFEDTLKKLRSMGPAGQAVAKELKTHLVNAGDLAEESIDDVIDVLHDIDPAAATAAKSIKANLDKSAKGGTASFESFGKSAISQIKAVAVSYIGISEAIQAITGYLQEQEKVTDTVLEKQIRLAKAQQEAAKNLAGLSVIERDKLLRDAAPAIASETGFSDVSKLITAIGAAASRGASSQQAAEAVRQAARIEVNTPDQLDATVGGAVAVQLQTGLSDIREAIALIETSGTQAAIVDPQKLIESLPKALGAAVATVRGNQEISEASRQAAAIFTQVTQGGNDAQGNSSATFTTDFTVRMDKFFDGFEDELIDARSKVDLIDRKIAKGKETEANRRDRKELLEFIRVGEPLAPKLKGTTAGETLFGRIETLQENPAVRRQFVGKEGFGEKQFATVLKDILDSSSATAANLKRSFKVIRADSDFFEREASNIASGSPQLVIANASSRANAGIEAGDFVDVERAALGSVRQIVDDALSRTRSGFGDFLQRLSTDFIKSGQLEGTTAAEETVSGIVRLRNELGALEDGGLTVEERGPALVLQGAIDALTVQLNNLDPRQLAEGSVRNAASTARSLASNGGVRSDFDALGPSGQSSSAESTAKTVKLLTRIADSLERQVTVAERAEAIAERSVAASESSAEANKATAANTVPRPVDPTEAVRARAALNPGANRP